MALLMGSAIHMMKRSLHRFTRRLRIVSFAPLAWWAWTHRADLRQAVPLLKAAPRRVMAGETADVVTEVKVLFGPKPVPAVIPYTGLPEPIFA